MSEKSPYIIERPSGTYYVDTEHSGVRSKGAHVCAGYGAILAPITNIDDFKEILKVAKDNTDIYGGAYHIGLEIAKDNSSRVFTNGEQYNFEKHGEYIVERPPKPYSHLCPLASFEPAFYETINVENTICDHLMMDYICFKPKKEKCVAADALSNDKFYNFGFFRVGAELVLFFITLFSLYFAVKNRKQKILQSTTKTKENKQFYNQLRQL